MTKHQGLRLLAVCLLAMPGVALGVPTHFTFECGANRAGDGPFGGTPGGTSRLRLFSDEPIELTVTVVLEAENRPTLSEQLWQQNSLPVCSLERVTPRSRPEILSSVSPLA